MCTTRFAGIYTNMIDTYGHSLEITRKTLTSFQSHCLFAPNIKKMYQHGVCEFSMLNGQFLIYLDFLKEHEDKFPVLFNRVLSILTSSESISVKTSLIEFVSIAAQRLDSAVVRKEIGPLVSIHIWGALSETKRNAIIESYPALKKMWKSSQKRLKKASPELLMTSGWFFSMAVDFLQSLYKDGDMEYANRFVELLIVLLSQLPTRRFTNTILKDLNFVAVIKLSPRYKKDSTLFTQLVDMLSYYINFPLNDFTGQYLDEQETWKERSSALLQLREKAFDIFPDELKLMTFANLASLSNPTDLKDHASNLSNEQFTSFLSFIGVRTEYPVSEIPVTRSALTQYFIETYSSKPTLQEIVQTLECLPTERSLFTDLYEATQDYKGTTPLPLHRMSLQYLSIQDFLVRAFQLARYEAFFSIRADLEAALSRIQPEIVSTFKIDEHGDEVPTSELKLNGFSRMVSKISGHVAVLEVTPGRVGVPGKVPGSVKAEVRLDPGTLRKQDWDSVRKDEVVLLAELCNPNPGSVKPYERLGLRHLRSAQVVSVLDSNDQFIKQRDDDEDGARARKLHVLLDPLQYAHDSEGLYRGLNVIIRRRQRENNFNAILATIKDLIMSDDVVIPEWLSDVFLGFGDPAAASYGNVQDQFEDFPQTIDYGTMFLDFNHLKESFPGNTIEISGDKNGPFILPSITSEPIKATSYTPLNYGPYAKPPRKSSIRFTPHQVSSIVAGSTPGLTLVEGPPGTGKTDVAVKMLLNIYTNFPNERTVVIAHSNQALNHIFEKLVVEGGLDLDKHLLRLGHGEEGLKTEITGGEKFSRAGRVERFLESRGSLLAEVDRLANSIGVFGAYGDSCETAAAFYSVYIEPMWDAYKRGGLKKEEFPFVEYFKNAPKPLFSDDVSVKDAAEGAFRHIGRLFSELKAIRPYELIQSPKERNNYMLVKDARIIAMTATHAAMNRNEIENLGFQYSNLIVEEAAQLTEIDNFIPLTLQNHRKNHQLRRVVLIGDDKQNAPIVQNPGLRQYGAMDQSLFRRLRRLGVPSHELDFQGRARPEIAEIYGWQYGSGLKNLPVVLNYKPKYNAGFLYTAQFINVDDFNNHGETEPSPHFIQNLGEAEYAVGLYQYMRLLGYPASGITILSAYMGQKVLIDEILRSRCCSSPLLRQVFGMPKAISTVDQYQGEQNDYVIVSLVRTKNIGYLRDLRRMTVALSRARLGLYVLGRGELIGTCLELEPVWKRLDRSAETGGENELEVVPGEMYSSGKALEAESEGSSGRQGTRMQGIEHFGQYVYEMTQTRMEYEKAKSGEASATAS